MVMSKTGIVTVPKTVKSKTVTPDHIHYTVHPKYMEISCNTKLINVGLDVTLMMLEDSINDDGKITDEQLFVSTLDKMVKRGKRPPSSTKGGKSDYTDEMLELETKVNKLIKGKKFVNNNDDDVSGRFYFRNDTKLKLSKDKKKKPLKFYSNKEEKKSNK